mgnify:CR=1 FL=1
MSAIKRNRLNSYKKVRFETMIDGYDDDDVATKTVIPFDVMRL